MISKTICAKCKKVLRKGNQRLHSAIWDSAIAHTKPKDTDKTIWAWCEGCYQKVKNKTPTPTS